MKQYYIVSVKHTSKGDAALTFWRKNGVGYTWHRDSAGIYDQEEVKKHVALDQIAVEKELADPYWMNANDFGDKYIAMPNTIAVCRILGIEQKHMKPKKYATCHWAFTNLPVATTAP